ncbi:hypothetical protein HCH15_09510 [Corynebacterium testudinoris]|uniref:Putative vancomycin resistance protein n=1 Tax=Corynebacterium testudinoris TaxID=136857 RepID=A0A0G3HFD4_9CORY|nr:VanW family protein [Corynebacterium testudinoris]AKK09857.1 putative vancomycin resistance protein [Corynebacterium testudinoris]MBX8996413.1 hypothetical protein [Corynebacterium testudinoris]
MSKSNSHAKGGSRRATRIVGGVLVGLIAVGGIAYGVDYALTQGKIPRGTTVGGIEIGGMEPAAARGVLETELGDVPTRAVEVRAGEMSTSFVPAEAGMVIDWQQTVEDIGTESANPLVKLNGLFGGSSEAPIVSHADEALLAPQLENVQAQLTRDPVDGAVSLIDARVNVTDPINGQAVDGAQLRTVVTAEWLNPSGVEAEAAITPPAIDTDDVDKAAKGDAADALTSAISVKGRNDVTGVIEPARMGEVVTFVPDAGALRTDINHEVAQAILTEALGETEKKKQNAQIAFSGSSRTVTPSVDGEKINWETTLGELNERILSTSEPNRTWEAEYEDDPATFTTEMAQVATFNETVGSFTTSGYSASSGVNISRVASVVNGAIVAPGDTFSLNGYTGPRGAAQGYVDSGIIINGRAGEAVGGGISQFATTLYNAAYFAGMEDVAHTAHSYYISRYPAGREATVFEGAIDLKFRNNSNYPVRIDTSVGGGDVTVTLSGVKTVTVESVNGGRWAPTQPREQRVSGSDCIPSGGAPGFTTSDTRIIRNLSGGEISRETQTTVYDPQPIVRCS